MHCFGLARKVAVNSKSWILRLYYLVDLWASIHIRSEDENLGKDWSSSSVPLQPSDFIEAEIFGLTYVSDWKGVVALKDSAMVPAVLTGIPGLPQPWKHAAPIPGGSLGRCTGAPLGISGAPQNDDFSNWAAARRNTQFCRVSNLVVQASSEVGQSEENEDPKVLKTTIYDGLITKKITVELFPELDFKLKGNFYPKLVNLVARRINLLLKEEGGGERVPDFLKHLGIKLSPHIVGEVMKLQDNLSSANYVFDWATTQPDFQHNSHTYNLKFWNLINQKSGASNGNLVVAVILLEEMLTKNLNPGNIACNVLVGRLCKESKVGVAMKLTKVLERKGFPDIYTYNSLISGLGKAGLFEEIFELLHEMKEKGCNPDLVTYNSVINWLSKAAMFKEVFELVEEMTQTGCAPDRVTYNSIIHGLCNAGLCQEALNIFEELSGKGIAPDVVTYNSLIVGHFKSGQLDEARHVYDLMGTQSCQPDRITYNILIDGFLKFSQVDEAWKLFYYMKDEGLGPDEVTYNILIGGLVYNHRMAEARSVFESMKEKGCEPSAITRRLLGLSDHEKQQHRIVENHRSHEGGNDSGSDGSGEAEVMEDEMHIVHS